MKIVLVNKFYYQRGGDCTAVLGMEQLLKSKGHEVAIFSMQYPDNMNSAWTKYFPKEVNFSSSGISGKISAAIRIFHSPEVARKFKRLITDFRPNVVHLHNIHSYLSPLVAEIAHECGIRVVWTLHDYKLVCPAYACLRNGNVCEKCFTNKAGVVRHKCMKNNYMASVLAYMEASYWNKAKLSGITDVFISPSRFLKTKMTEAGYVPEQIEVLPNFMPRKVAQATEKEDYYCYAGRISAEKGIDVLLEAAENLPYPLKVIGGGALLEIYRKKYPLKHIEFLDRMTPEALYPIIRKARFVVIPSVCYENNPFSAIEALCMGTPVLGAQIGGIPELIDKNNGRLFIPGDINDLRDKINQGFSDTKMFDYGKIASDAHNKFSPETFYNKLTEIYNCY